MKKNYVLQTFKASFFETQLRNALKCTDVWSRVGIKKHPLPLPRGKAEAKTLVTVECPDGIDAETVLLADFVFAKSIDRDIMADSELRALEPRERVKKVRKIMNFIDVI